jgi:hypothetical protein
MIDNQISVSKQHAFIKYENGKFILFDNDSKFGTTVLLRGKCKIEREPITLQIGSTIITLSLIPTPEKKIHPHLAFIDEDEDEKTQIPGGESGPASNIESNHGNLPVSANSQNEKQDTTLF